MIKCILLPLDGSALAESSVTYAAALQRAFDSDVILLRVIEANSDRPDLFSESRGWRLAESEGRCYLKKVAERFREQGIEPKIDVTSGVASDEILNAIQRWNAELVILGSHGTGNAVGFPIGGTTAKVISSAASSFLVVRADGKDLSQTAPIQRVVVPMDGSPRSEWAMNLASTLARANGAELALLHVVTRPEFLQGNGAAGEAEGLAARLVTANQSAGQRYLDERKKAVACAELKVSTTVVTAGSVPRAVEAMVKEKSGTLLALCAHGHSAESGWPYGNVATALLSFGSSPVLVFQDLPRGFTGSRAAASNGRARDTGSETVAPWRA